VSTSQAIVQKRNSKSFKDTEIEPALPREEVYTLQSRLSQLSYRATWPEEEPFYFTYKI